MVEIIGYKDISLEEMGRIFKEYVNRYRDDIGHLRFANAFYAFMDDVIGNITSWHANTILNDSDRIGVHKMRMKVGLGESGIQQIPYRKTTYDEYDNVFDIEVVYDGEYRDSTYDVTESVFDVFHVNMEVIV